MRKRVERKDVRNGKRILAMLTGVLMVVTMMPSAAFADTTPAVTMGGWTEHQHDENCGYAEAIQCNHEHDDSCGRLANPPRPCPHETGQHEGCSYREEQPCRYASDHQHSATTLGTCITPAVCECGSKGPLDSMNHESIVENHNAREATDTEEGYTGDEYCEACQTIIEPGTVIPPTGNNDTTPEEDTPQPDDTTPEEDTPQPDNTTPEQDTPQPDDTTPEQDTETDQPPQSAKPQPQSGQEETEQSPQPAASQQAVYSAPTVNSDAAANDEAAIQQEKEDVLALYEALGISAEDLNEAMPAGANDADLPAEEQTHRLEDFKELRISNLLIADGNRNGSDPHSKNGLATVHVQETLKTVSDDNMRDALKKDLARQTALAPHSKTGVQSVNVCAINADDDREDEFVQYHLYKDNIMIIFYDVTEDGQIHQLQYTLDAVDDLDGLSVEAMATKGLMSMASGDYDRDGREELAYYVPGEAICFAELTRDGKGFELQRIEKWKTPLSEIRESEIYFSKWRRPVVSLSTTSIAGEDDLVVNISMPLKDNGVYKNNDHLSTMAILSTGHQKEDTNSSGSMEIVYVDQQLGFTPSENTSNEKQHSIRFASAVDADLNGDGIDELLVGGFRTQDFNNSKHKKGKLDKKINLIHAFSWNEEKGKYTQVWDYPKEVPSLTGKGLHYTYDMQEPAAFAAGKLLQTEGPDQVFLEGVILQWSASGGEDSLAEGEFLKMNDIKLEGTNNSFISTVCAASYSEQELGKEQLIFISGHEKDDNEDLVYYDIGWVWGDDKANIYSTILDDNYVDNRNEDDSGTHLSICAMDADASDTVYYEYQGKELSWTDPELLAVIPATPYWEESDSAGSVWWTFNKTSGSGSEVSTQLGITPYYNCSVEVGAGIANNNVKIGMEMSIEATANHAYSEVKENSVTKEVTLIFDQGRDYAEDYTAILGVPLIRYHYKMWIPEYVVTKEQIESYKKIAEEKAAAGEPIDPFGRLVDGTFVEYKEGDIVEGHYEDCSIDEYGQSTYAAISLKEYNEVAENSGGKLEPVSKNLYPRVTIGDPTTYPISEDAVKAMVKSQIDLGTSDLVMVDNDPKTESRLAYTVTHSENTSHGFNVSATVSAGATETVSLDLVVSASESVHSGLKVTAGAGKRWYDMSSESTNFAGTFCKFDNYPDSYNYSTRLAVYKTKLEGDDKNEYSGPYVMGYIVPQLTGNPPKLAENFKAQTATENTITLTWENPDYRAPKSYRVFIKDKRYGKNAEAQELAHVKADEPLTVTATGLDADTSYEFAIMSYGDKDGEANPSCMSSWMSQRTKPADARVPIITQQPQDLEVTDPTDESQRTFTVIAEKSPDAAEDELRYQWQKYNDVTFKWVDVEDGREASYVVPEGDIPAKGTGSYRVVVTQMHGSQPFSIHSDAATLRMVSADST